MVALSLGKSPEKKNVVTVGKSPLKMDAVNYCQQERLISQSVATFSQL